MRHILLICSFLAVISSVAANTYFEYSPLALQAYEKATSLRFKEARVLINKLKLEEPDNLVRLHIEDYLDFFALFINEKESEFEALKPNKKRRIKQIEKGDENSPYYLYLQADILLHWALARLKFGEYFGAFRDVSKAYRLLKANQQLYPRFLPNYKDLGILHAMVGTIPNSYKWGVELLSGLEGTIQQGRSEIELAIQQGYSEGFAFQEETFILYAYLLLHLDNNPEKAWKTIQDSPLDESQNPLHCFVKANIAMRIGKNDVAIAVLSQRPRGRAFQDFPYLNFMLGTAKLRRLDADADQPLLAFIQRFQGKNFIKEAYQKLAWNELVQGRPEGYKRYMKACISSGFDEAGGDKNAMKEATSGVVPDESLVEARLLFDGGYFQKAYQLLLPRSVASYPRSKQQLEYTYRMGRILHGLNQYQKALDYYQRTIESGRYQGYYFACNAALQAGIIHEALGDKKQAERYFELCLDIKPDEYKTGLHQKAKSGLERLRE